MSDCEETLRAMFTFLDGELTPSVRASVDQHLHGCVDCQGAFEFELELRQMIARRRSTVSSPSRNR